MYEAQGGKQSFVRTRLIICRPVLNLCDAGAAKRNWKVTAALEEAKTKNALLSLIIPWNHGTQLTKQEVYVQGQTLTNV